MSPVARESIKAASIVSLLVGLVTLGLTLVMVGQWSERKADRSEVQANTERLIAVEHDSQALADAIARFEARQIRLEEKLDRYVERGR